MTEIKIIKGDILELKVDCIVNPSNKFLTRGGGLSGKIFSKAGIKLINELNEIKKESPFKSGLIEGLCIYTKAYNLPQKYILHTLGPNINNYKKIIPKDYIIQDIKKVLLNCYENCLSEAKYLNCKSIAFPSISTGNFGVNIDIAIEVINTFISNINSKNSIPKIYFVLFNNYDYNKYVENLKIF